MSVLVPVALPGVSPTAAPRSWTSVRRAAAIERPETMTASTSRRSALALRRHERPSPARARLKSLVTHTVFGCGLYACAIGARYVPLGRLTFLPSSIMPPACPSPSPVHTRESSRWRLRMQAVFTAAVIVCTCSRYGMPPRGVAHDAPSERAAGRTAKGRVAHPRRAGR